MFKKIICITESSEDQRLVRKNLKIILVVKKMSSADFRRIKSVFFLFFYFLKSDTIYCQNEKEARNIV